MHRATELRIERKERLGQVCALRHGAYNLQFVHRVNAICTGHTVRIQLYFRAAEN